MRQFAGEGRHRNYIFGSRRRLDIEPFFSLGFGRQPLVISVNHCPRVRGFRRRRILVGGSTKNGT